MACGAFADERHIGVRMSAPSTGLRMGEWVEVRPLEAILATLDERGGLGGLPFMPEMVPLCGRRFRVRARADKTCDRVHKSGNRRMRDTVHLGDLRCGGEAHDGCQAACLLYFKEAWLRRVDGPGPESAPHAPAPTPERLKVLTRDGERYFCQATEAFRASEEIPSADLSHYVRDVRNGNATVGKIVRWEITRALNRLQDLPVRGVFRLVEMVRGPFRVPRVKGSLAKTPVGRLDLRPAELVRVKSLEEIRATLDAQSRNRGLSFDIEMAKYCGGKYRVLDRVERIIDEPTGRMLRFSNDCIILDQVVCAADYHGFCPRAIYPFWREIWLERVERHGE